MHNRNDVAKLIHGNVFIKYGTGSKASDAFASLARGNTERVPIDELEGRVTISLFTPYPLGIPLLIPGERFNNIIVRYLRFARNLILHFQALRQTFTVSL